jgi:hypothetical protein
VLCVAHRHAPCIMFKSNLFSGRLGSPNLVVILDIKVPQYLRSASTL